MAVVVETPRGRSRRVFLAAVLTTGAVAIGYGRSEPAAPAAVASDLTPPVTATPLRIPYGDAADTFGELYLPVTGAGRYPVVVLIHGGGWAQSRTLTEFSAQAGSLAAHGVAVWNIEYRRVHGAGGWPTTLTDVEDAVTALATIVQSRVGNLLDLQRVHLAGYSAGGHLAAWISGRRAAASVKTAGAGREIRIRSVALMAAVLDLEFAVTNGRDGFVRKLLGGSPSEVPDRYDFASPIAHLPTGLRVTAVHGDTDRVVALEQSRRYVSAATRAGNSAELRVLPGTGHTEFTDATSPAWATARTTILDHVEYQH
ncbi:alpha/beta hydrolase family protein [Nocardia asiatica]|uniref:alpha/beta hydrolase family protein n=1 Tax=Nocardia asiatica TaxID=209252 RepID=UPI003EE0B342